MFQVITGAVHHHHPMHPADSIAAMFHDIGAYVEIAIKEHRLGHHQIARIYLGAADGLMHKVSFYLSRRT